MVHGDLSEYNILVAPVFQVDNPISSVEDVANDLQAVLIDFGQAVDRRHPEAMFFLRRDLDRVRSFFMKKGVKTLDLEEATEFVVDDFANNAQAQRERRSANSTGGSGGSSSSGTAAAAAPAPAVSSTTVEETAT